MYMTNVPPCRAATRSHGMGVLEFSAGCPVAIKIHEDSWRLVNENPDIAAAADAAVTPGTITTRIPAAVKYAASSPILPKTKGSPPFKRTTCSPRFARVASSSFI